MVAKKKVYKLDLFPLLDNIAYKNTAYFDNLSEEQKKEFQPFLIMRWLTGCNPNSLDSKKQIFYLNAVVNPVAFTLGKHKKLLYDLMSASCVGQKCRKFVKANQKRAVKYPKVTAVIQSIFGYSSKDAMDALPLLNNEAIVDMASDLGYQKEEMSELKKELRKRK